ncbi:MAG: TSUP family transporter, partial [Alphaproteobacteria bacterium]
MAPVAMRRAGGGLRLDWMAARRDETGRSLAGHPRPAAIRAAFHPPRRHPGAHRLLDLCIAATGLVVGLLVGLTSIGGVLVVPVLVVLLGLSPHDAIPAAMASFVAPTAMALLLVHRRGELD